MKTFIAFLPVFVLLSLTIVRADDSTIKFGTFNPKSTPKAPTPTSSIPNPTSSNPPTATPPSSQNPPATPTKNIPNPTSLCEKLEVKGSLSEKFDLVILPDSYSDYGSFYADAAKFLSDIKSTNLGAPLSKINFWLYTDLTKNYNVSFGCFGMDRLLCHNDAAAKIESAKCGGDHYLIIHNNTKYGGAGGPQGIGAVISKGGLQMATHELSHSIAFLADEYDYGRVGVIDAINCTANGSNDTAKPCPGFQGKYPNTTCHRICSYSNMYRSSEHSVMENGSNYFNPPSLDGWANALKNYQ